MTTEELDHLLAGIAPVIRSYVTTAFADLQKQVVAIDAKAAVPGPGISSLLISADSRLVAHLTDGRTLDVGPVPVKEPVPGPAGRDADPVKVFALETELATLRAELSASVAQFQSDMAKAEEWRVERAQLVEELATVKRFGDDLSARVDVLKALPVPRDGQDGVSVTVDDVAPLIVAEVQKSVASLPMRADVAPAIDVEALVATHVERAVSGLPVPKDGVSVSVDDVAQLIASEVHKAVAGIPVAKDGAPGEPGEPGAPGQNLTPADVEPLILEHVAKAVAGIPVPLDGRPGADGVSVSVQDVAPLIAAEIQKAVAALPVPQDGKDGASVDPFLVETLVATRVERAVAALQAPKDGVDGIDGKSVELADVETLVSLHVEKAVAAIPPAPAGKDGQGVTVEDVTPLILAEVQKAAALIPAGKDGLPGPAGAAGKTVTVDDVAPLIVAEVQKAVYAVPAPKDGAPGRDGVGALGALIDRAGHLVVTLSDGTAKDLGIVVGQNVDVEAVKQWIVSEVAKMPIPKDGAAGTNGRDGFGFDDLDLVSDDRGVFLRFVRGGVTKEFRLPVVVDRGVFSEGRTYGKGDGVTWGGSFWIAQDETTMKPDFTPAATKFWRLAVKEGRKGKDADPAVIEAAVNKAVAKLPKPKTQETAKW